ncbi:MAG: hypothetical protein GF317_07490 [Candidatus Lokiarchaeota archaeon]|nr:hypothetical protein [Candidatus Lokiarchaeota archaeon]MBD3199552.1 hypothetical protein [Candidatus Lokiarchaeota archaeon]
MIKDNIKQYEDNIANILNRSIHLFRKVGNNELADKWDKILRNYTFKNKIKPKKNQELTASTN